MDKHSALALTLTLPLGLTRRNARLLAAAAALCWAAAAPAATLQVTVLNSDGRPATDTVVQVLPTSTWSAQPLPRTAVVEQKDLRFVPYVTAVPVGGSVRFVNLDNFDHHVRSQPGGPLGSVAPAKQFEFRLSAAKRGNDTSPELKLDLPGAIVVGCHLHNSMRGHVLVVGTPWYAVTDDKGRVRIEGVPAGQAELRLWHPDQLTEQPLQRVQLVGGASGNMAVESKLNFSPRRRPPSRTPVKGEYD